MTIKPIHINFVAKSYDNSESQQKKRLVIREKCSQTRTKCWKNPFCFSHMQYKYENENRIRQEKTRDKERKSHWSAVPLIESLR